MQISAYYYTKIQLRYENFHDKLQNVHIIIFYLLNILDCILKFSKRTASIVTT